MTITEYYNLYLKKYAQGIPYSVINASISHYLHNSNLYEPESENYNKWQAFLRVIRYIEKTIPSYDEQNGKVDDHHTWLKRAITFFDRANLEETAVKNSEFGKENHFEFYKPEITQHLIFHPGPGTGDPDLVNTETGELYDVKHDSGDGSKAHKAKFVIRYPKDGTCTVHTVTPVAGNGSYTGVYFECPSVAELATAAGLPSNIFFLDQSELEQLLGFIED